MIPKFRVWDKEADTMHDVTSIWFDRNNEQYKLGHVSFPSQETVDTIFDNFELMQSTGLKDKNGVEIFEGDIVQWGDTPGGEETPIRIAVVKINPDIQFDSNVGIFTYGQFAYKNTEKFLTVLGNIYEKPELLEVE